MSELDAAKENTVCYKKIIDRKPYFPESEPLVEVVYKFRPVVAGKAINIYHVSDSHGRVDQSIAAEFTDSSGAKEFAAEFKR